MSVQMSKAQSLMQEKKFTLFKWCSSHEITYCCLSPVKHFFALSGSPVNYNSLNLDTPGHQPPSLTSKGVTTRRCTKLPAGLFSSFNELVFLLLGSILALWLCTQQEHLGFCSLAVCGEQHQNRPAKMSRMDC